MYKTLHSLDRSSQNQKIFLNRKCYIIADDIFSDLFSFSADKSKLLLVPVTHIPIVYIFYRARYLHSTSTRPVPVHSIRMSAISNVCGFAYIRTADLLIRRLTLRFYIEMIVYSQNDRLSLDASQHTELSLILVIGLHVIIKYIFNINTTMYTKRYKLVTQHQHRALYSPIITA